MNRDNIYLRAYFPTATGGTGIIRMPDRLAPFLNLKTLRGAGLIGDGITAVEAEPSNLYARIDSDQWTSPGDKQPHYRVVLRGPRVKKKILHDIVAWLRIVARIEPDNSPPIPVAFGRHTVGGNLMYSKMPQSAVASPFLSAAGYTQIK